ncbi:purine-nucleoside phosphorylase [Clostridium sp. CAG:609]|nr:purine-nucleoside phosphorylase [Clostridium sp. CAG:609]
MNKMFLGENPIHIEVKDKSDIAQLVLMPGDPLRAKYIAENFLDDVKCVTSVRNMLGFTGFYKGKKVTVMGSGMGMPSMGIYAFELFHYFNVEKIIRIGTCGAVSPKANINDMILSDKVYSESNFAYTFNNYRERIVVADPSLNKSVMEAANELSLNGNLHVGMLTTMDVFGPYIDFERVLGRIPKNLDILGEEMEAFGLIHIANSMGRKATAIATVVDSKYSNVVLTIEQRQTSLNNMIKLALEAIIKE